MNVRYCGQCLTYNECQTIYMYFNQVRNLFLYRFGNDFDANPSKYTINMDSSFPVCSASWDNGVYTIIIGNDALCIYREINDYYVAFFNGKAVIGDINSKIEALKFIIAHELAHIYLSRHQSFIRGLPSNNRVRLFGYYTRFIPNLNNTFCFALVTNSIYFASILCSFHCSRFFKIFTIGINCLNLFYGWISRAEEVDADRIAVEVLGTNVGLKTFFDKYAMSHNKIVNFLLWPFFSHPPHWYRKSTMKHREVEHEPE